MMSFGHFMPNSSPGTQEASVFATATAAHSVTLSGCGGFFSRNENGSIPRSASQS